jgi:hypothetical protein
MARFIGLTLATLVVSLGLSSTSGASDPRRVAVTVFSPEPISSVGFRSDRDAPIQPLTFYPTARSSPHIVRSDEIEFVDTDTERVIGRGVLPEGAHQVLFLLLRKIRSPASSWEIRAIIDDDSGESHGNLRVLNYSGLQFDGSIDGHEISMSEGDDTTLIIGKDPQVTLRTKFKSSQHTCFAETLSIPSGTRAVLLLLPPYRRGSLDVQSRLLIDANSSLGN